MTRSRTLVLILIVYSAALTVAVAMFVVAKGGVDYVGEKLGIIRPVQRYESWQLSEIERFRLYPSAKGKIVFLGDSITAATPWAEYYSSVQNRGIGGDTSLGVLTRLAPIAEAGPAKVFINLGTNDLAKGIDPQTVADNIANIIKTLRRHSSSTVVYNVSVLPINPTFFPRTDVKLKSLAVQKLNVLLRAQAASIGARFIDVYPAFVDGQSYLKRELTIDGTHLNERGKTLYAHLLENFVQSANTEQAANGAAANY